MRIRDAIDGDIPTMTAIYDREVVSGTATFDLQPPGEAPHRQRIAAADSLRPVLVLELDAAVVAWAALVDHSARTGWRSTAEVVIYVADGHQGRGLGRALLDALIDRARTVGLHALVARITADNTASLVLHDRCGFTRIGTLPEVGRKFDRWLDVVVVHRLV